MPDSEIKKGGISVETQHIFPIIKKWLYSDKDIFLREIVSNASDAVTKLRRLCSLGEATVPEGEEFRIDVELDRNAGTVTVTDNGIGMTPEELEKYICSIALSGALDFISKYEKSESGDSAGSGIIGHFGLGFYSAFMVSDTVEIDTLSYAGGGAVHWKCGESGEYEITPSDRTERGTSVVMHITDEEKDYLNDYTLKRVLDKYCSFIPVPIYFSSLEDDDSDKDEKKAEEDKEKKPINDTTPLWSRSASEITDEEYTAFYHKLFADPEDPLFHIHVNADYPLNFKGILYFPKIRSETQSLEGQVKLFYNQVFVADNIKEVLPDYLLMLRGALDCPELPLNVSRSYLQDSAYVKRIGQFIVKKTADKFNSLATSDREKYEAVFGDVRIFIEYACIRDRKFYDRIKDNLLLRLTDGTFATISEYTGNGKKSDDGAEAAEDKPEEKKEEKKKTVYYATDTALQAKYISMLSDSGIKTAIFDLPLDAQYLTSLEEYDAGLEFVRVDAAITDAQKAEGTADLPDAVRDLFRKVSGNEKLGVKCENLKDTEVPALLLVSEQSRRFADMMKLYTAPGEKAPEFPVDYSLTLNASSKLYEKLCTLAAEDPERAEKYASFMYGLAQIAQKKLSAEELSKFLSSGYEILGII